MTPKFVNPNLHVILIHYPLGLLVVGTMIELFAFLWRRSSFRLAGRWMILLGALSMVPACFSGIYALNDVARYDNPANVDDPWVDVRDASPLLHQGHAWQLLSDHTLYNAVGTGIVLVVVLAWLGMSDRARRSWHFAFVLGLLWGMWVMIVAAWHGGEAIYRFGAAVKHGPAPTTLPVDELKSLKTTQEKIDYFIDPLQSHVILAGYAVAVALAAIALSFRKITATVEVRDNRPIVPESEPAVSATGATNDVAMVRSFNPDVEVTYTPFAPAARFWLLASLLALVTIGFGWWFLALDSDALGVARNNHQPVWQVLWNQVKPQPPEKVNRRFAHVVAGGAIAGLPLLLAAMARWTPRRKFLLSLVSLLLVAAVAAQVWLGVLMLYDSPSGPVQRFNASAVSTTEPAVK